MQPSYSACLFVAGIENFKETFMTRSSSLSKMRSAMLPLRLEYSSVKTVQLVHGSPFPGVSFAKKSTNTCAFNTFRGSKEMLNSDSSTDHLVFYFAFAFYLGGRYLSRSVYF
ncbi:unnamed protein product [Trifolium pratense]|uniref:Uncharacterized protein n=1 Tax=Trifolium pratense TaxID=57577 RepID=A0ACB0M4E9_TRIPR|nr:unnamed protein product [Trifolium pratense]